MLTTQKIANKLQEVFPSDEFCVSVYEPNDLAETDIEVEVCGVTSKVALTETFLTYIGLGQELEVVRLIGQSMKAEIGRKLKQLLTDHFNYQVAEYAFTPETLGQLSTRPNDDYVSPFTD